jgi:16S rRNA (guanine527-N7)-methyltransferase
MSQADDEEPEENELPDEDSFSGPVPEEELDAGPALDPEDLGEIDGEDLDDDDEEEEDEEEGEEAEGAEAATGEEAKPKSKTKKKGEDDPPGPDIPAPSLKDLRAAMGWAFEEEDIEGTVLDRFAEHARLMLEGNRKTGLTTILDPKEIAAKHYLDCWRLTQMMSLMGKTIVDLGSGPGFPGLPLALAEPHCKVILVDMNQLKTDFNLEVIEKMGIKNAVAHCGPAEEYLEANRVDTVLVRNVSSVRENVRTLRKVRHSLKDLMMLKGASWSREVRAGEREAERLGFILDTVWEHELPSEMGKRAILVYRAPGAM